MTGSVQLEPSDKSASNSGTVVTSSLTVMPSFVVQVKGLSPDTSVSSMLTDLKAETNNWLNVLKSDRSALVKFRRHKYVCML